jgi:hypothetical protein
MATIVRTVKKIFDCKTGDIIQTNDFFNIHTDDYLYELRMKLQSALKGRISPIYICPYCSEKLQLLGGNKGTSFKNGSFKILHFAHYKSETECPQKSSDTHFFKSEINIMKYNGQKEGEDHKRIKDFLAKYLWINESKNEGVTEVSVEKNWRGNDPSTKVWKRPDVKCSFNGKKIAFEIQLSTTFLSVIEERQHFYKENKGFILWVFKDFVKDDNFRRLTDNDVIFSNNQNAFVLDEEAVSKSEETGELTFKCYFKSFDIVGEKVIEDWDMKWVTLNELIFDNKEYKVFGFDVNKSKVEIDKKIKDIEDDKRKEIDERNRLVNYHEGLQIEINNLTEKRDRVNKNQSDTKTKLDKTNENLEKLNKVKNDSEAIINSIYNSLDNREVIAQGILSSVIFLEMVTHFHDKYKGLFYYKNEEIKEINVKINDCDGKIKNIQNLKQYNDYSILEVSNQSQKNFVENTSFSDLKYIKKSDIGQTDLFFKPYSIENEKAKEMLIWNNPPVYFFI